MKTFECEECGEPFTEFDKEQADLDGIPCDPDDNLCPRCYQEELKRERRQHR